MPLLSVIIPVYNESATIGSILNKIIYLDLDKEIIVVDDGSTDGTDKVLRGLQFKNLKVIHHTSNRGKGAAFRTGLAQASGEFVIIQDADLEYNPADYLKMIQAMQGDNLDLVLGARFTEGHKGLLVHRMGNRFLTTLLNLLFGSSLNDYATCYKLARRSTFESLGLISTGFDIDVEIICNALKKKLRIREVSVSYQPRSYREGKKIRWIDGIRAIFYIFKYRFREGKCVN